MGMGRELHAAFSRYVAWPIFGRMRPGVSFGNRLSREAREWYRLSQSELETRQARLLRRLLAEAQQHVPYYRNLFREIGFSANSFHALSDLEKLPALSRATVQTRVDELKTERKDLMLVEDASGGSSGRPVIVYHTAESIASNVASKLASDMIAGYRLGGPMASLWGGSSERKSVKRLRTRLLGWGLNTKLHDSFNMDEERMMDYHRELSRHRPDVLLCYASSLHIFAQFLADRRLTPSYPLKGLITSAEMLTSQMRDDIGRVFVAPLFNRYGSRETGMMGMECEVHDGMHCVGYHTVVETIDPATRQSVREQPGEVLVTVLRSCGMPLIRYELGDYAILSDKPCPCGRPGPILRKVLGRTCDSIRLAGGRLVHGEYFTHLLYGMAGLMEFRFVQHDLNRYELLMVTDERYDRAQDGKIQSQILELTGPQSDVRVLHVDRIDPLGSGKRQFITSLLTAPSGVN